VTARASNLQKSKALTSSTSGLARTKPDEGDLAVDFIQRFCVQSKGTEGGTLVKLRDWQQDIVRDLLVHNPDNGLRKHRTALIGMPKKNGKSLIGSALATYFLNVDPEPGGEIFSLAAAKEQAGIVFNETKKMIEASPLLLKRCKIYKDVIECVSGTVYKTRAADAKSQDGINPSVCIFDEVHRQPNSELWSVVQMGMATRRQPLLIGITTAGAGPEGLCWDLYDFGKRVQSGEIDDPSFFFRWFEPADLKANFKDEAVWKEANPGLGDFISYDAVRAEINIQSEADFRRLRLNQWPSGAGDWLPKGAWEKLEKNRTLEPGKVDVVFAFDGSFSNDSTALVGCTIEHKPRIFVVAHWEKPINQPSWRVDVDEVERSILEMARLWKPKEIVADPYRWQRSLQYLAREIGEKTVLEFPQSPARMVPATQRFYQSAVAELMEQDGSKALARHIGNAKLHMGASGGQIRKTTKGSGQKIDLAVCAIMAFERASVLASKAKKVPQVWDLSKLI
jgi:phage terminase large subunit-like protein